MENYKLTNEGKKYLENGLPEKNLLNILKNGPIEFQNAKEKIENFSIAIQWVKKKKLVEIKNGKLFLIKNIDIEEQKCLEDLEKGKHVNEDILNNLIERKLVEKISHDVEKLEKSITNKLIENLTPDLIATGLWKKAKGFASYEKNFSSNKKIFQGKLQPYRQVINNIRQKFLGLGFTETSGPYIESEFWNFDTSFIPQNHPARIEMHDTFNIKSKNNAKNSNKMLLERVKATHESGWITGSKGWGKWNPSISKNLILRTQTTAVSNRTMSKLKNKDLPYKMFTIGRVFRKDVIDSSHLIDFDQLEFIIVADDLNFEHLLGYLKEIGKMLDAEEVRFKPSFFPFTEPSLEIYVKIKNHGWLEVGGAGIMRPEVTIPLGIEKPVLAGGIGLGRLAMIKIGISDVRDIYSENIEWLRNKSLIK